MQLELKHIRFSFSAERQILRDLSFVLEANKIYALMGSNGAGKTTLFNILSGFIKPESGSFAFGGVDLTHKKPYLVNRNGISRTFQDLRLITRLTVKENIVLAMKQNPSDIWYKAVLPGIWHRKEHTRLEQRADELILQFFLGEVSDALAAEISYGQQKLLSLACCVANGAQLLLLDEAVAGIQPEYRNKIAILIRQLKAQGKTILLIEHNTDFIADVADHIFFLHDGAMSSFANIDALRKDKQVMEAYT